MNAFTLTTSDKHDAREVDNLIPRDTGLTHIREGGEISANYRDAYYTIARVEQFESPFVGDDASRVVQEEIGGTTYVVTETDGFVSEEALGDAGFWEWMGDDMAVVAHTRNEEEPHAGMTCEYTGEVIEGPWYQVMWTDSYDEPFVYEGPWDGLEGFVHFVIETHDEENGWMLRAFDVTTGEEQESGDLLYTKRSMAMNHTGDIDTTIAKWTMYEKGDTEREEYFHTWEFGDDEDENSPIEQFDQLLDPNENHGIFDVSGFASFVREGFSGSFIVSVTQYEG